jgi:hypothetical protein
VVFIVELCGVILSIAMLSAVIHIVIVLRELIVMMLYVIMLNVIMPCAIITTIILTKVKVLSAIMPSSYHIIVLSYHCAKCQYNRSLYYKT